VTDSPDETKIEWQLSRRRSAAATVWALTDEIVLIGAGEPIEVPGRGDLTYPFRAHSEYFYLTDRNRPGGTLAFDPQEGWFDFVVPITASERLWFGARGGDPDALPADELDAWVASRRGRRIACLGARPTDVPCDAELTDALRVGLSHVRRIKDPVELERMYLAERATSAGFAAVVASVTEGTSEREAQIELEAAMYREHRDRDQNGGPKGDHDPSLRRPAAAAGGGPSGLHESVRRERLDEVEHRARGRELESVCPAQEGEHHRGPTDSQRQGVGGEQMSEHHPEHDEGNEADEH